MEKQLLLNEVFTWYEKRVQHSVSLELYFNKDTNRYEVHGIADIVLFEENKLFEAREEYERNKYFLKKKVVEYNGHTEDFFKERQKNNNVIIDMGTY